MKRPQHLVNRRRFTCTAKKNSFVVWSGCVWSSNLSASSAAHLPENILELIAYGKYLGNLYAYNLESIVGHNVRDDILQTKAK